MTKENYYDFIENIFIKYAKINTRSDENSATIPSTDGQRHLAKVIYNDLKVMGCKDVVYDETDGYVVATLPNNASKNVEPIGFVAHLDTADFPADNVRPLIHRNYDGKDVLLNKEKNIKLTTNEFPHLKNYIGQTLITSDGTTLLGVDDKAGIAAAITTIKYFIDNPNKKHGTISFAFGPDEEIGLGAKRFDVSKFPVNFAYTLDNGLPGQIEPETFNAAQAKINIKGTAVHPGNAYKTMANAITIANEIIDKLPKQEVPENSKDRDGFFLVTSFQGSISEVNINIIIREFDNERFIQKKKLLQEIVKEVSKTYTHRINLSLRDQYENINSFIQKSPYIVDLVLKSYHDLNLKPHIHPFRGGTDGNFISKKGIPTPNLFNGGENFHGPYEFVTTENMLLTYRAIKTIVINHFNE